MEIEIKIGQRAVAKRIFGSAEVLAYAELTGDFNPIHFDEEYAKNTIFKKPIVHGPLVITLITTMFANELPGPGSVYLSHDIKYLIPVYYGDEIEAVIEVVDITEKGHYILKTICTNQHGGVIMSGTARLKKF